MLNPYVNNDGLDNCGERKFFWIALRIFTNPISNVNQSTSVLNVIPVDILGLARNAGVKKNNDRNSFFDVEKWPPVIFVRREMTPFCMKKRCHFHKNKQIYLKKNDPCRIMTPLLISVFILIMCKVLNWTINYCGKQKVTITSFKFNFHWKTGYKNNIFVALV